MLSRTHIRTHAHRRAQAQGGFSLVEMMVGMVVSGLVVAAAGTVTAHHIVTSREAAVRLRAEQDLRAVSAVLKRWARQAVAATPGGAVFETDAAGEWLRFAVMTSTDFAATPQPVSIRLADGAVQWRWGEGPASRWQALTDGQSVRVESLRFESLASGGLDLSASACLAWPALQWTVQARAATSGDPMVWAARSETHRVQVRVPVPQAGCES